MTDARTYSNEPGQPGSSYPARAPLKDEREAQAFDPRMAFCPACFEEVRAVEADQQTLDARRYRWLRDYGFSIYCDVFNDEDAPSLGSVEASASRLDAAIDAALAAKGKA